MLLAVIVNHFVNSNDSSNSSLVIFENCNLVAVVVATVVAAVVAAIVALIVTAIVAAVVAVIVVAVAVANDSNNSNCCCY